MSDKDQSGSDKEQDEAFKLFLDERKVLIGLMSANNIELSKSFITLSTFSLGYTLYRTGDIENKTLLIWTGILFLLTILSVMVSFILGSNSLSYTKKKNTLVFEAYYKKEEYEVHTLI